VHALALGADERPLDVHADDAGHALGNRLAHGIHRMGDHLEVVADQRRQESRGAEAPVRTADVADRVDRRRLVEEHAAAAVHLRVDEARHQHRTLQVMAARALDARIAPGGDRDDAAVVHEHGAALDESLVGEDGPVDDGIHQWVRVTFCRCGGLSGSMPRAMATALASR